MIPKLTGRSRALCCQLPRFDVEVGKTSSLDSKLGSDRVLMTHRPFYILLKVKVNSDQEKLGKEWELGKAEVSRSD